MNEGEKIKDAAVPENPAMAAIEDVPGLPRVLLIGDSISIAYTLAVRRMLAGKANVHRALTNCQSSQVGLENTTGSHSWQGEERWDAIHFNFGIWDTKINPATGLPNISKDDYVKNVCLIARRFQATGAKVIFATTTPIPENLLTEPPGHPLPPATRFFEDVPARNAAACAALSDIGVVIDDLYSAIYPSREEHWNKGDLHFEPAGSEILAQAVAESIAAVLQE